MKPAVNIQQTRTSLTSLESDLHEDTLTQDALTVNMGSLYKLIERLMDETFKAQEGAQGHAGCAGEAGQGVPGGD